MKRFSSIATALILCSTTLFSQTMNINTDVLTRIMPKSEVKGNATVVTAGNVSKAKSETVKPAKSASATADSSAAKPQQPVSYYTLVLASHVSQKNAAAYVEKLHKAGFNEAQVYSGRSTTRVIFNQYKSEAEAYGALHEMREYTEFNDAWVYKVEG